MKRISKLQISESLTRLKTDGFLQAWKLYRWRLVIAIFLFYLIRDVTLYVVLPYILINYLK